MCLSWHQKHKLCNNTRWWRNHIVKLGMNSKSVRMLLRPSPCSKASWMINWRIEALHLGECNWYVHNQNHMCDPNVRSVSCSVPSPTYFSKLNWSSTEGPFVKLKRRKLFVSKEKKIKYSTQRQIFVCKLQLFSNCSSYPRANSPQGQHTMLCVNLGIKLQIN